MTPRNNYVCIVGGAMSLQGSKMGKLIDSHPVVIRCNNHPIEGHEEDVGEKVTIQSTNFQFMTDKLFYLGRGVGEHWLMTKSGPGAPSLATISDFDNVHGALLIPPSAKFEVPSSPEDGQWQQEYHAHPYPTTGLMTLATALQLYASNGIAIIGYGYRDRVEPGSYEYDKDAPRNRWGSLYNEDGSTIPDFHPHQHDLNKEQALLNLWESRGLLTRLEGAAP